MSEFLYLIRCCETYKIGIASDVRNRLATLQTGNPYKLELVDCFQFPNAELVEKAVHQRFAEYRTLGEWFEIPNVLIGLFGQICEILGGVRIGIRNNVTQDDIDDAEKIQEEVFENSTQWDFAQMFATGWRIEILENGKYWRWRERRRKGKVIYGGTVESLPASVDEIRKAITYLIPQERNVR